MQSSDGSPVLSDCWESPPFLLWPIPCSESLRPSALFWPFEIKRWKGAMSGECGEWFKTRRMWFAQNAFTGKAECAGALSWWMIQDSSSWRFYAKSDEHVHCLSIPVNSAVSRIFTRRFLCISRPMFWMFASVFEVKGLSRRTSFSVVSHPPLNPLNRSKT